MLDSTCCSFVLKKGSHVGHDFELGGMVLVLVILVVVIELMHTRVE